MSSGDVAVTNEAISNAISIINEHPAVDYLNSEAVGGGSEFIAVRIMVRPSLPRKWCASGKSPNGIQTHEPVTMWFSSEYPLRAPLILLRQDFPRQFPHMYPRQLHELPVPCIFDGNLSEFMIREGFTEILNQLASWFERAAMDELTDYDQGWEPTRRDTYEDMIVADAHFLRSRVSHKAGCEFYQFNYSCEIGRGQAVRWRGEVTQKSIRLGHGSAGSFFECNQVQCPPQLRTGTSLAILAWPPERSAGKAVVADQYSPETVYNVATLRERAVEFNCAKYLFQRLDWLKRCMRDSRITYAVPIVIILCARRPTHLINSNSALELCYYVVELDPASEFAVNESTHVRLAAHHAKVAPQMLMSFSGDRSGDHVPWIQVGAGSLGSKIALHLARAGRAPKIVIDSGKLRPHNAARHGLTPPAGPSPSFCGQSKASALTGAISALGQDAQDIHEDIVNVVHDSAGTIQWLPESHWAIINSTASLVVREALSAVPASVRIPRVIETSLYASGDIGLFTVEGPQRNPNTTDIFLEAHKMMLKNVKYRSLTVEGADPLQRHMIGEGCGSLTTPMSDAQISMLGAPMARILADLQKSGLPNATGRIYLGSIAEDGYSISWEVLDVRPWTVLSADGDPQWKIRLSAEVDSQIRAESASYTDVETGGILMGRFSEASQTFHVCDLLPAPADTVRTPEKFVLGTKGVTRRIEKFQSTDLYCLGTWHSHLTEAGPSSQDWETAGLIGQSRLTPSVLLIRTPTSYCAVLAKPSSQMTGADRSQVSTDTDSTLLSSR